MKILGEHPLRFEVTQEEMFSYERMDVNFFRPEYVEADATITRLESKLAVRKLGNITKLITDGPHQTPEFVEDGVIFLQKGDVTEGKINFQRAKKVSYEFHQQNPKTQVFPKDILLRKIGVGPREAAVVPEVSSPLQIYVSLAVIRLKDEYSPDYVEIFLNSSLGRSQTERRNKGTGTPDLHLEDIREIKVPLPLKPVQTAIINVITKARKLKEENTCIILELKTTLFTYFLEKLGLHFPETDSEPFFYAKIDELGERLDAHFYDPKYQRVIDYLKKGRYPLRTLEQISSFRNKHIDPKIEPTRSFKYIQLQNIDSENHVISSYTPILGADAPGRAQMLIREGDILLPTLGGSLESVAIVPKEYDGEVATNGFAVLNVKDENLRYYVLHYLTTWFAQAQIERLLSGTIMPSVIDEDLKSILIPLPDAETLKLLSKKISMTNMKIMKFRDQSEKFLEDAKAQVERILFGKE